MNSPPIATSLYSVWTFTILHSSADVSQAGILLTGNGDFFEPTIYFSSPARAGLQEPRWRNQEIDGESVYRGKIYGEDFPAFRKICKNVTGRAKRQGHRLEDAEDWIVCWVRDMEERAGGSFMLDRPVHAQESKFGQRAGDEGSARRSRPKTRFAGVDDPYSRVGTPQNSSDTSSFVSSSISDRSRRRNAQPPGDRRTRRRNQSSSRSSGSRATGSSHCRCCRHADVIAPRDQRSIDRTKFAGDIFKNLTTNAVADLLLSSMIMAVRKVF